MAAAGLTPRSYQQALANAVRDALAGGAAHLAVQAGTGVGKTWALAATVLDAVKAGRRVIWSTHTTLLRGQVLDTLHRAASATGGNPGAVVRERRGMTDYPSATRTLRLWHSLRDQGGAPEAIEQLARLGAWTGTLAEFEHEHGSLLVPSSLVCLTPAGPAAEQAAFIAQRSAAAEAAVVVQTHALTLLEARFNRLCADLVIFDEADALPGVAASAIECRLSLADLAALAEATGADIAAPLEALQHRASQEAAALVWRDGAMADAARRIATGLRAPAAEVAPDLAVALRDAADDLGQFASIEAPKTGAALITDLAAGPLLAVAAVDAAGWLGKAMAGRQTVLMSATLGRHEEDDLGKACRRLGFHDVARISVAPGRFGSMAFRLADRAAPTPFVAGDTPNPAFFDYAAGMVMEAARAGRTLVLCASYTDAKMLAERLDPTAIVQQRGDKLAPLVDRFRARDGAILVTPGGWAGLDLPGLVANIVILRLPVPRPDPLREAILAQALERRGYSAGDARSILAAEGRADTARRLTQGMGRGIRVDTDACTVWIADPRFPLPASRVADLRSRLVQGPAAAWEELALAIPTRFRRPLLRSAFDRAQIVRWHAPAASSAA